MSENIIRRNGNYYYYRRVPAHVKPYDNRPHIKISLKTRDEAIARRNAYIYNEQIEAFWKSLIDNGETYEEKAYKNAVAVARLHGFTYKKLSDLAKEPLKEIVERVNVAASLPTEAAKAVLGAIDEPELLLSACLEKYWPLCVDRTKGKSEHQFRKWKNPRKACFEYFIECVSDKPINHVERKDALLFRSKITQRMTDDGLASDTANKMIMRTRDILKTVSNHAAMDIDFDAIFKKLMFKGKGNSRPPFEAKYVQETILTSLAGLNQDAQMLVYAMADTGARESELIQLRRKDIFLDEEIPYIWIRPNESGLKTENSERRIPLVGCALYAFKTMPNGFTRYEYADSASNLINKYFTVNKLRPTEKHSLYSLRHTLKDRLRDIGAPEEVIDEIMGHEGDRPKYGRGHMLETKHKWLEKIAFKVPVLAPEA